MHKHPNDQNIQFNSSFYKLKFRWGLRGFDEVWDGNIRLDKGLLLMARPYPNSHILNIGYNNSVSWESRSNVKSDGIVLDFEAPDNAKLYFSSAVAKFVLPVIIIKEKKKLFMFNNEVEIKFVPIAEGIVNVVPNTVTVGKPCNLRFVYTAGRKGIKNGGGIRMVIPQRSDWHRGNLKTWSNAKGVKLKVVEEPLNDNRPMEFGLNLSYQMLTSTVRIAIGEIKPKEKIYLAWDRNVAQTVANDNHIIMFTVDPNGDGIYHEIRKHPSLKIKPDKPAYLNVIAPSLVGKNDCVNIKVYAMDKYHNRIYHYKDWIQLSSNSLSYSEKLPTNNKGEAIFVPKLKSALVPYVKFTAKSRKMKLHGKSNPMVIRKAPRFKIYWGELHIHTQYSDGYTTPEFAFTYARDVSSLDFTSTSDHSPYMTQYGWARTRKATREFNNPGHFVVFLGYETSAYNRKKIPGVPSGDINVYFLNDDEPLYYEGLQVYKNGIFGGNTWVALEGDLPFLRKKLLSKKCVMIPHHLYAVDGNSIYEEFGKLPMSLMEIYSEWGSSEFKGNDKSPLKQMFKDVPHNFYFQDLLKKGYVVGVSAGGDDHNSMPGNLNIQAHTEWPLSMWKKSLPYQAGITAVYAENLNRKDILKSMLKRHTFATTGVRIFVDFRINQSGMGEILPYIKNLKNIEIHCTVAGLTDLKEVTIIKNNRIFFSENPRSEYFEKTIKTQNISKGDYYYLRIRQKDNHMAWSSPIWIR